MSPSILFSEMQFQADSGYRRKRARASPRIQSKSVQPLLLLILAALISSKLGLVAAFLPRPTFADTARNIKSSPIAFQTQTPQKLNQRTVTNPRGTVGSSSLTQKRVGAGSKKKLDSQRNPASVVTVTAATDTDHKQNKILNRNTAVGLGTAFSLGIVYTLAARSGDGPILEAPQLYKQWVGVADNVLVAALPPSNESDVVSVALADGLSGVIGSGALFGLNSVLTWRRRVVTAKGASASAAAPSLKAEALADGDFFLARAAALPLLEAVGIPPFLATIASVVFATVPYEFVKFGSRQKRQNIFDENEAMQTLLDESLEKERKKGRLNIMAMTLPFRMPEKTTTTKTTIASPTLLDESLEKERKKGRLNIMAMTLPFRMPGQTTTTKTTIASSEDSSKSKESTRLSVDLKSLKPVQDIGNKNAGFDLVEVFSDITKWLEYDILQNDFSGQLSLLPGIEGALFGSMASLSAQLYADILYVYFAFGPDAVQAKVKSRTGADWAAIYLNRFVVGATLFGVYEGVQIPLTSIISAVLSGGVTSCIDSIDYNMCIEVSLLAVVRWMFVQLASDNPESNLASNKFKSIRPIWLETLRKKHPPRLNFELS
jgi:hypothetical protein